MSLRLRTAAACMQLHRGMDGEGPASILPVVEGYAAWAASYDSAPNPTRDLEGAVLRDVLSHARLPVHLFERVLEVGCGTGKNSRHLSEIGRALVCVDVSAEMLVRHPTSKMRSKRCTGSFAWLSTSRSTVPSRSRVGFGALS